MKKMLCEKRYYIFYLVTLSIFCLILLLNCLTPMAADDYAYSFIFGSEAERVDSLSDILISQWNHYFTMNGRTVGHTIAQFFLWLGKPVFNLFNSLIFIIYINLISYFCFGKRSVIGILSSFLMVWFMLPDPGSVLFWLDGASNYLWGGTFILLFIFRYYKNIFENTHSEKNVFYSTFLWFLFGIIAGWCNENSSGMGILICCLLTIYIYKTKKRMPLWEILGILGAILGFSLMIAAPGNFIRLTKFNVPSNLFRRIYEGFVRADLHAFSLKGTNSILFFLFLFTYSLVIILPKADKERKIIGGVWFLGALACNYAMALSPGYPDRASFGVFSMYFISILYSCRTLIETFKTSILIDIAKALLFVGCLSFLISYSIAAGDIGLTFHQNNKRVKTVLEEKSKGNYSVVVPGINAYTKYNVFAAIRDWPSYGVAAYFEMNSINIAG